MVYYLIKHLERRDPAGQWRMAFWYCHVEYYQNKHENNICKQCNVKKGMINSWFLTTLSFQ